MANTTTYTDTPETDRQHTGANAGYAEGSHTRFSSIMGIGIVVAMLIAMIFLQTQASASPF